jgi:hypothetical protein
MKGALTSKGVWAILLLLCLDAAVFRSGLYLRYLKPLSYAGMVRYMCSTVSARIKHKKNDIIGLVGDSRLREGFSARVFDAAANQSHSNHPYSALNMAVSASTLRVWYYLLKHVDPDCRTFKVIVLALPSYFDEDYWESESDNLSDLQVLPVARLADSLELAASFNDATARNEAFLSALLHLYAYRRDLRDFAADPGKRLSECAFWRNNWERNGYLYEGRQESLGEAKVVGNTIVGLPDSLPAEKREGLQQQVFPIPAEHDFQYSRYMRFWLNRIASRYSTSETRILVVHIPNNPLPTQLKRPRITATLSQISQLPQVTVDRENHFASLNEPGNFYDAIHLNKKGRPIFSKMLSQTILQNTAAMPQDAPTMLGSKINSTFQ